MFRNTGKIFNRSSLHLLTVLLATDITSASETYGYCSEKSSATLTCDDYTDRVKDDLLGVFAPEDW